MEKNCGVFPLMTILALAGIMLVSLAGCTGEFSVSTAKISDAVMAASINPNTQEPVQKTNVFAPSTSVVYVCGKISNAPSDTKVQSQWFYENEFITSAEITVSGTDTFSFSLAGPATGWPAGNYAVKLLLDGREKTTLTFKVQ